MYKRQLVLMPFKLDYLSLKIMSFSISFMLSYAEFISALPYSNIYVPKFSHIGITMIALGGTIITIMQTKIRLSGIPIIMWGLILQNNLPKPDILIDSQGKLFAVQGSDGHLLSLIHI